MLVKFIVPFGPGAFPIIFTFEAFLEVVIVMFDILNTRQYQTPFSSVISQRKRPIQLAILGREATGCYICLVGPSHFAMTEPGGDRVRSLNNIKTNSEN